MKTILFHGKIKNIKLKKTVPAVRIIMLSVFLIIIIGTLLLMLPISSKSGAFTNFKTASFTAVSATCLTGLIIQDTATYWNTFGQSIILIMIQIGGLGFMTLSLLFSLILRRAITPRERLIAAQSYGLTSDIGTVKLARRVLIGTFSIEFTGACLLATQFIPLFGLRDGIYYSIFHSISAFCNAGFDLFGNFSGKFSSLVYFRDNITVNIVITLLIIIGGLGFVVWNDIVDFVKDRVKISIYTKFITLTTLILIFGGTLLIFIFEYTNVNTMSSLPLGNKILASFFQSVTTRTAGFCTVDNALLTENSKVLSSVLMFIGGASGSTAGGVKVSTINVIILTMICSSAGLKDVLFAKRNISHANITRAIAVTGISLFFVLTSVFCITSIDGFSFVDTLFECTSAMGTVGLTASLTPLLSSASHYILMLLMFFGKVGILTVTFSIMLRSSVRSSIISYPEINFPIG